VKRLFGLAPILVTAAAVASAYGGHSSQGEPAGMLLIGVALVLTACITREKVKSR
jgi:hypothetical protein